MKENRSSHLQSANLLLLLHCLQIFIVLEGNGGLIGGPQNTAADDGQTVTLICRTENEDRARWSVIFANSEEKEIYNGARVIFMNSVFKVNDSRPGQFDLQFTASTKAAATQFICLESFTENSEMVEVIVLESPTCSGNVTSYACSVKFTGNWIPQLNWVKDGEVSTSTASEKSDDHLLTSTLVVSEVGDSPPVCEIKFARDNYNGSATATNVPDYKKTVNCTSNKDLPIATTSHPPSNPCGSGCVAGVVVCGLIFVCVCGVVLVVLRRKKLFPFSSQHTEEKERKSLAPTNGGKIC